MNFSDRLKQARDEKNLTQAQLEDISGVSNVLISNYESGKGNPTIDTVFKLEVALKLHRGALIGFSKGKLSKADVRLVLSNTKADLKSLLMGTKQDVDEILKEALEKINKY